MVIAEEREMTQENEGDKPLADLDPIKEAPVTAAHGIAAIALSMAMKYHDIATVQDGALYQQYKLEGKNLCPLHLDMVFDTAIRIENHLLASSERIAKFVVDAVAEGIANDVADDIAAEAEEGNTSEAETPMR